VLSTVTCRFDVDRDVQAGANALGNHAKVLEQLKAPRHATGLCLLHVGVDADLDRRGRLRDWVEITEWATMIAGAIGEEGSSEAR
jgi:hypothetical protein